MRNAGIGYENVDATEPAADRLHGFGHRCFAGHVGRHGEHAGTEPVGGGLDESRIDVQQCDLRSGIQKHLRHTFADGTTTAGDHGDLAFEFTRSPARELGLLQRPVLHVEEFKRRQRFVLAQMRRRHLRQQRVFGDVADDRGRLGRRAAGDQAQSRCEHDAGIRIECDAITVGFTPSSVVGVVFGSIMLEYVIDVVTGLQNHRQSLGADGMIRSQRHGAHDRRQVVVFKCGQNPRRITQLKNEPGRITHGTAEYRQHIACRRRRLRGRAEHRFTLWSVVIGGEPHQLTMQIQRLVGGVAPGEETVLVQYGANRLGMRLVGLGHGLGQREAGHDPRQVDDTITEEFTTDRITLDPIGHGEDRVGMTVVDEPMWQKGMQQCFDGWSGSGGIEHAPPDFTNHVFIGHVIECPQGTKSVEIERRQPWCFDGGEIPARTLDPDDFDVVPVHVLHHPLAEVFPPP